MTYETVIWEQSGAVGSLTLNRPETLNAWTRQFGEELLSVVQNEAAEDSIRAVLITGSGRGFSSGADLRAGFDPADDGKPDIYKELHGIYHPVIAGVRRLLKPVVAAVNGPAVGRARAFQMALLGERIPAPQALEWGLVNWIHPDERLMDEAWALARRLAAGPTRSYASSKQALNNFIYRDLDGQLELEAELQHALGRTNDFMEGVAAFVEKRDPAYGGN